MDQCGRFLLFTVDHAGSAESGRAALRAEHFDLAVLDVGLPGVDGLIAATAKTGSRELEIIAAQEEFVRPSRLFVAERI